MATTHNVTSTLTGCTVLTNFYGGGSLGKVDGAVTSTLDSCTVLGNVYGAGYSASKPTVPVMDINGFITEPRYDQNLGTYLNPTWPTTTDYTWEYSSTTVNSTATAINPSDHILYTNEDLNTLGTVTVKAILTIKGNTSVGTLENGKVKSGTGNVYGGGEESKVEKDAYNISTEVFILERARIFGNVYGGGNMGEVGGDTKVIVNGTPPTP